MFDPPSLPAAGWYPDPQVPDTERWWNGREWEPDWRSIGATPAGALPDIGDWLGRAVQRAILRWRSVAIVALLTGAPASVLFALVTRRLVEGVVISDTEVTGWSNDRLPYAITLGTIAVVLSAVGALATTSLMLRTVDDVPDPTAAPPSATADEAQRALQSIGVAFVTLPRAVGWTIVLTLAAAAVAMVIVVAIVLVWPLGVLLILIAIPLLIWAAIRLAFLIQALVDRRRNPIGRSAAVSAQRWWAVFGRLLLIGVIAWGISMVVNIASSLVNGNGAGALFGQRTIEIDSSGGIDRVALADAIPVSTVSIIAGVIGAVILNVCASSLSGAAMGELYRTRNAAD